jgi:hypothetical protein
MDGLVWYPVDGVLNRLNACLDISPTASTPASQRAIRAFAAC